MSAEDKLFNFVSGLKPWAQNELRWQKVSDLPSAIAAAEALVDFRPPQEKPKSKGDKPKKTSPAKRKTSGKRKWKKAESRKDSGKGKSVDYPNKKPQNEGCFICRRPHLAHDCPKKS